MGTLHTLPSGADDEPARELTLSERVAWVNAYERSIVASEGAVVIEIESEHGVDPVFRRRHKDPVFPDCRTGRTFAGEREFPGHRIDTPLGRVVAA